MKFKFLLILLLFVPALNVKANTNLTCTYRQYQKLSAEAKQKEGLSIDAKETLATMFLECDNNGSCKILSFKKSSGFFDVNVQEIGENVDEPTKSLSESEYRTSDCPSKVCVIGNQKLYYGNNAFIHMACNDATIYGLTDKQTTSSNKYELSKCDGNSCDYIKDCGCIPASLTDLTSRLFNLIKIVAPVLLLIVGGFDLVKAVTAADEKAIQKEQTKLIKKFVAAFIIFMLFTIVQFLVGLISKAPESTMDCVGYFINGYNPESCE